MNARASLHVPGVASWIEFRAAREQRVRAVRFPRLTLVRVREGAKEICHGGQRMLAHAATLLLAPAGSVMDVCNQPGAGRFRSECLTLDPTLVERFAVREASLLHSAPPPPCVAVTPMLAEVWAHAMHGWETPTDARVLAHRLEELLLALALAGHGAALRPAASLAVSERVRRLLLAKPGADWRADQVAAQLHCSAATLRRQLARERAAFSDILRECRLGQALMLLQTSPWPVARIAAECGYDCASRFAVSFRQRYGLSPSALRATLPPGFPKALLVIRCLPIVLMIWAR